MWNALVNLAWGGISVAGVGVGGDDVRAGVAFRDAGGLGVDMSRVARIRGLPTITMHHFPIPTEGSSLGRYCTRSRCPCCGGLPRSTVLDACADIVAGPSRFAFPRPALFLADKLTIRTAAWAGELGAAGWTTIVDIGYPGYLNFRSPQTLLGQLSPFGVIVMQATVARFLARRLCCDAETLAATLDAIIIVSDGRHGLFGIDGRGRGTRRFDVVAPECEVIDSVGAGDAFVAGLLGAMLGSGHTAGQVEGSTEQIRQWCVAAVSATRPVLAVVGPRGHLPGALVVPEQHNEWDGRECCVVCGARARPAPPTR
ncbi:PfkB family carbohydrate kinase [Nocardia sp. JCM 34519.1]|uniref:PfkB family carbohydrate kinase n=1 Tax=Nocardia sp. JCM 34519.1 TaxID=2876119 RepID=UPI001CE4536B|nr:PfkB family carbohydrate kinase [Nocardia sp. JCM 34519.1]